MKVSLLYIDKLKLIIIFSKNNLFLANSKQKFAFSFSKLLKKGYYTLLYFLDDLLSDPQNGITFVPNSTCIYNWCKANLSQIDRKNPRKMIVQ